MAITRTKVMLKLKTVKFNLTLVVVCEGRLYRKNPRNLVTSYDISSQPGKFRNLKPFSGVEIVIYFLGMLKVEENIDSLLRVIDDDDSFYTHLESWT